MHQLQIPPLADGETYIGAIGDKNGEAYHIILLPGDKADTTWQDAMDWAESIGGELPTRIEQAMLWAGHKNQFQGDWYWSSESHERNAASAWYQGFSYGYQDDGLKDYHKCRARAVRRLPI